MSFDQIDNLRAQLCLPTIHRNGSPGERLLDGILVAVTACTAAIQALEAAGPNARDYYPQGDHAFSVARKEHGARVQKLSDVLAELTAIADHVCDSTLRR